MKPKLNCILLIDDDEPTNFIHRRRLEMSEVAHRVEVAWNGREALEFLRGDHEPPDLILLDVNMPVMDGWEFLEEYGKLESSQKGRIVIVMLTTSFNPDDRSRAESNPDVSGFQHKPLTGNMIDEILGSYFSG